MGPRNWTIWGTEKFIAHAGIGTLDFRAHGLVTIPTSLPWLPYYEGRYESNTSYFFSETIVTIITKLTHIVGTSCTKLRSFSHKICFTVNTIFISLRETLCADRVKPFAEGVGALHARCVAARLRQYNGVLGGASFRGRPSERCTPKIQGGDFCG